ncbi:MAG: hypothetical protein ACRBEQ_06690 [Hyphomonas sp.]
MADKTSTEQREARRKAALRANLRRRKTAARSAKVQNDAETGDSGRKSES